MDLYPRKFARLIWHCSVLSEFPTTSMEMQAVADKFDRDGDGFIDYKEFVGALRPERGEVTGFE